MNSVKIAILGGSGYVGAELLRLLENHSHANIVFVSSETYAGMPIGYIHPHLRSSKHMKGMRFSKIQDLPEVDVIFSCLSNGVLPTVIQSVAFKAKRIFNLSGDYRFKSRELLDKYYPKSLPLDLSVTKSYYIPEFHSHNETAQLLNLPGCMAVASIYAIYPLIKNNLAETRIVIDAKSGASGAGKQQDAFSERANNFRAHKLHGHRHSPEIETFLAAAGTDASSRNIKIQFSTFSLDQPRGIFISAYTTLRDAVTEIDVNKAYLSTYKESAFVQYLNGHRGQYKLPMLKTVVGTNNVEVATSVSGTSCVAVATLDNLMKGAAGQAVQAFNKIFKFAEDTALKTIGMWP